MEAKCTTRHTLRTLCPHHSVAYYVRNSVRTHYIRTYADAYTYIHTYIHTYMHTCIHTCMLAYIHACMHTCIHTYMHAYMHTCIHAYMHTYMHTYIHTCMHACMHACIHACIHTHTHTYHSGPSVGCDPKPPRFACSGWAVTLPVTTQARWWLRALEMSILKHAAGMRSLGQEFRRRKGAVSWLFRRIPCPNESGSIQDAYMGLRFRS